MADAETNQGLNKLAQVMQERMNRNQTANSALVLDFGTIQADMSLKTNTFSIPIPQADYHVCRQLTLGPTGSLLTETKTPGKHGGHTGGDGSHDHQIKVPEKMRSIKSGDRVLVAWVQSEAVVIDIILRGTEV
jgi:hypothetical protein